MPRKSPGDPPGCLESPQDHRNPRSPGWGKSRKPCNPARQSSDDLLCADLWKDFFGACAIFCVEATCYSVLSLLSPPKLEGPGIGPPVSFPRLHGFGQQLIGRCGARSIPHMPHKKSGRLTNLSIFTGGGNISHVEPIWERNFSGNRRKPSFYGFFLCTPFRTEVQPWLLRQGGKADVQKVTLEARVWSSLLTGPHLGKKWSWGGEVTPRNSLSGCIVPEVWGDVLILNFPFGPARVPSESNVDIFTDKEQMVARIKDMSQRKAVEKG